MTRTGRRTGRRSLRRRLLIGLGMGWAVIVCVLMVALWYSGQDRIRDVNDTHLEYEARLIAQQIDQEVELRLASLQQLSATLAPRAVPDAASLQARLRNESGLLTLFDGLIVTDAEGRVQAAWPRSSGRRGTDVSDRLSFRFQQQVGRPHVSEPFTEQPGGTPWILFSVPLADAWGHFAGMVGGLISVENGSLFAKLRRIRLGRQGFAVVMTASGKVLTHPRQDHLLAPAASVVPSAWRELVLDGWQGTLTGALPSGKTALQSYRQIWTPGWIVGVFLPADQAFAPLRTFLNQLWLAGGLTILLMLPMLAWLIHLLLRPLRRLTRQIEAVRHGHRDYLDVPDASHEIVQLIEAFNRMVDTSLEARQRLLNRQAFLDAVLDSSPVGMFVYDMQGELLYVSPALTEMTGHSLVDYQADSMHSHIHPDDRQRVLDYWLASRLSEHDFQCQYRYVTARGESIWMDVHASLVRLETGKALGFVGTMKDITEHRENEALQRWEAEHDPLTGLLNRRGFERRMEEALADWLKGAVPAALIAFDLDHFKPINDEGGHALGDRMLSLIARTLAARIRRSDFAARYGGDEFAILLPGCGVEQARRTAEALRKAVGALSVTHEGRSYRVSLSLGVTALAPGDETIGQVMQRADDASYRAKAAGRDRVEVEAAPAG
ncbi:MAG: PAS/PAC sensor-containing diguanylate cyclase [Halomonadaceae bacterium T82-2]|nr:MAG: PAS/PAC sensor-containing diguanylate cyclase [Halomonadaceae bacterium T82-2]